MAVQTLKANIRLHQHVTEVRTFTYTVADPDGKVDPKTLQPATTPVDVTGWSAKLTVRDGKLDTSTEVFTLDTGGAGGIVVNGTEGEFIATFDNSVTALLVNRRYYGDLLLIDPTDEPVRKIALTILADQSTTVVP